MQFLGVHQPGERNAAADALSRTAEGRQRVLQEVADAQLVAQEVSLAPETAILLEEAMACPLRE